MSHPSGYKECKASQETGSISYVTSVFILVVHICSLPSSMYLFRAKTWKRTKLLGLNLSLWLWYAKPPTASLDGYKIHAEEIKPIGAQSLKETAFSTWLTIQYIQTCSRTELVTLSLKAAYLSVDVFWLLVLLGSLLLMPTWDHMPSCDDDEITSK